MFGNNSEMKKARAVVRDPLKTIASMLIRNEVVGENLENFNFEYKKSNSISSVNTGNFFKLAQKNIRLKWGENVNVLPIIVSSDKTDLTKCGKRTIWPIYVTCGNFSTELMTSEIGSQLSGFCPYLPYNDEELKKMLFENFISAKGKQKTCLTILKRYFEQKYFAYFIQIIKVCDEKGPIYLQIGKGSNSKVALFMPVLLSFVGDNEGAGQIMCIKSSKCNWPCRICDVCKKKNIHIPGKIIIYSINKTTCL
jgi:hypothetical protein